MDYNFRPKIGDDRTGWYKRGYLPHFDGGETAQFFTFRLFDSLPADVVEKYRLRMENDKDREKIKFRKNLEKFLDAGSGECFLKVERVAVIVRDALFFHNKKKYDLSAWVIMPNHLHFLARPFEGVEIREIAHSIKSFTAHEANKILGRSGQFWMHEPFDRYIRDYRHYVNVIRYIGRNPVKAGLCNTPEDWRFSSAYEICGS